MGRFTDDVVVHPVGPARYRCALDDSWDVALVPQGGIVTALGLRASGTEVGDPALQLRTCTTVFAGQVAAGEIEVDVAVLRRGRSATQVAATVRNVGAASGATVVAVFGGRRRGPSFVDVTAPDVPAPQDCPSYRDPPPPGVTLPDFGRFWRQVEGRAALGHPPWEQFDPTTSDVVTWLRFDQPPRLEDGSLDPLGVVALADRMPGPFAERTGNAGPRWFAPSADLTVHLFAPLRTEWLLAHDRARWADDGWGSVESTLWDEDRRLVGYATQMVFFTYFDA